MSETPDPRFLDGQDAVLTNVADLRWAVTCGWQGQIDMTAQIDKPALAAELRYIADQLDPSGATLLSMAGAAPEDNPRSFVLDLGAGMKTYVIESSDMMTDGSVIVRFAPEPEGAAPEDGPQTGGSVVLGDDEPTPRRRSGEGFYGRTAGVAPEDDK